MKGYILSICLMMVGTIAFAYNTLEYKGAERNTACYGQCYVDYVAIHGTTVEIEQRKKELANADEFSSIRGLWAGCAACHGPTGGGGVGPMLAGQSSTDILTKLTTYKNNGQVGPMSQMMWGQAANLSDKEIEQISKFVQEGFPSE